MTKLTKILIEQLSLSGGIINGAPSTKKVKRVKDTLTTDRDYVYDPVYEQYDESGRNSMGRTKEQELDRVKLRIANAPDPVAKAAEYGLDPSNNPTFFQDPTPGFVKNPDWEPPTFDQQVAAKNAHYNDQIAQKAAEWNAMTQPSIYNTETPVTVDKIEPDMVSDPDQSTSKLADLLPISPWRQEWKKEKKIDRVQNRMDKQKARMDKKMKRLKKKEKRKSKKLGIKMKHLQGEGTIAGFHTLREDGEAKINGHTMGIEIQSTPDGLEKGLMYRDEIPSGKGMLLKFGKDHPTKIWMKNVKQPLDIIYIKDNKVIDMFKNAMPDLGNGFFDAIEEVICDMVLELPAGDADKFEIEPGDMFGFNDLR